MFDIGIGFSELLLLAVIVIIVVGPEELPSLLRTVGRYVGQVKRIADDFRSQVNEAIKETGVEKITDDIKDEIDGVTESLDDPFGEEDLIDFEEHNRKILEDEKKGAVDESATQKALREGGLEGFEDPLDTPTSKDSAASGDTKASDDVVLTKKSGT
jgi:sec-independent protein translocase protein TatB